MNRITAPLTALALGGCTLLLQMDKDEPSPDADADGDLDADTDGDGDADLDADADAELDGELDQDGDPGCNPSEWLCGWAWRRPITIAAVDEDLVDFVVAVRLEAAEVVSESCPYGEDLRFTLGDGITLLDHELEGCDPCEDDFVAWVRIPTLLNEENRIYLYTDNPFPGAPPTPEDAWPLDVFAGVWHLDSGEGSQVEDSTANGVDGLRQGTVTAEDGIAGPAVGFDLAGDLIALDEAEALRFGTESFAFSVWVRDADGVGPYDSPFYHGAESSMDSGYSLRLGQFGWDAAVADGYVIATASYEPLEPERQGWTLVTAVVDRARGELALYVNGAPADPSMLPDGSLSPDVSAAALISPATYPFYGTVDEVRVYSKRLSAVWVQAEYDNLWPGSGFVTIGEEEPAP